MKYDGLEEGCGLRSMVCRRKWDAGFPKHITPPPLITVYLCTITHSSFDRKFSFRMDIGIGGGFFGFFF